MPVDIELVGGDANGWTCCLIGAEEAPARFPVMPSPTRPGDWVHVPEEDGWPGMIVYLRGLEYLEDQAAESPVALYHPEAT